MGYCAHHRRCCHHQAPHAAPGADHSGVSDHRGLSRARRRALAGRLANCRQVGRAAEKLPRIGLGPLGEDGAGTTTIPGGSTMERRYAV